MRLPGLLRNLKGQASKNEVERVGLKTYELDYKVTLLLASIATVAFAVALFLNVGLLGYQLWLWLSPLPVYLWPPAVHRSATRDKALTQLMERLVRDSKVLELPESWARDMVQLYYVGIPLSIIVGLALAQVYQFAFPAGGSIVALTYFLPWVRAMDIRSTLRREVELELPVVTLLLWGLSEVGYDVMRMIATLKDETEDLRAIPREFARIYRDFVGFGMRPDEAVLREVENHPSKLFERVLGGAIAISSVGGDLSVHFSRMANEVLAWLKGSWERYGAAVSNLGELSMLFLLIMPLLGIWFALVQGNASFGVDLIAFFLVPFMGVGLYLYVSLQEPLDRVTARGNVRYGLLGSAIGLALDVAIYLLGVNDVWLLVALPVLGGSLGYGLQVHRAIMRKNDVDSHMPILVRAIGEHVRTTGDNLYTTVTKLVGNESFGKEINDMLRRYLVLSTSVEEPVPESESWMGKTIFRILVLADREGVLRYEILRKLAEFADSYYDAVMAKRRSLLLFLSSALASPLILVAMIALTYFVLTSISNLVQLPPVQPTPGIQFPAQFQGLIQFFQTFQNVGQLITSMVPGLELTIVEVGIIYGVLLAKGYDGTVRNTFRIFELVMISVVANLVLQFVVLRLIG